MLSVGNDWWKRNITIAKLLVWCRSDIDQASKSGTCGLRLWVVALLMRIYLCADTQEVEGINSIIRHLCTQCKHIGLVLVNSRVIIKKALGLGSKSQPVKWSHRRPHALAMLRSSMQHYDEGRRIIKEELYRWDAAQRDVPLTHVQHQMIACQRQTDSMSDPLVKLNSLLLHRAMKQPDVTTLLTFEIIRTRTRCSTSACSLLDYCG